MIFFLDHPINILLDEFSVFGAEDVSVRERGALTPY